MSNKSYHSKENNLVMIQGGEKKVMKKILSVALSTAMAFSMFASVAFGDTAALTSQQKFDALKEAKIVTGYPDGSAHLEKDMTRAEFAKVVSSLMGLKPIEGQLSFKDKGYTAKNWSVKYIEAVYSAGLMEGKNTTKKIFDYNGKITVQEMAAVLVRALKLEVPTTTDNNASAWAKGYVQAAVNAGILSKDAAPKANATRAQMADTAYAIYLNQQVPKVASYKVSDDGKEIVFTFSNNETHKVTLDAALSPNVEQEVKFTYDSREYTAKVTWVVSTATKIQSVSSNNYKQITVVFDGEVDKDTAGNPKNYNVNDFNIDTAVVGEDGKSVVLTFEQVGNVLNQQKEYTLDVNGVRNSTKSKTFNESAKFTPIDVTVPTVKQVSALGTKAFKVVFSEPVLQNTVNTTSNFKIDGKAVSGSVKYTYPDTVIISTDMTVGNHTLSVANVTDYAGFKVSQSDLAFTVVEDTIAPEVVSAKTYDLTKVEVKFNESVKSVGKVYHTGTSQEATRFEIKDDTVIAYFEGTNNKLAVGETTLYLNGVTDYSNNSGDRTVKVTPVLDTERPTVVSVKTELEKDAHKFTVEFSESVVASDAVKGSNYVLKDKDNKVVVGKGLNSSGQPIVNIKYDNQTRKATFTLLGKLDSGKYTLEVSGIRDVATIGNTMIPSTSGIDIGDTVAPEISSAWYVQEDAGTRVDRTIYVQYSEAVAYEGAGNAADVNKYNIAVAGATYAPLPAGSVAELVNAETVRITLPRTEAANKFSGTISLRVAAVSDIAGNYIGKGQLMDTVQVSSTAAVAINKAEATAVDTIKVEFKGILSSVDANDFTIGGNPVTLVDTTQANGKTTATLKLAEAHKLETDYAGTFNLVVRATPTSQDAFGNTIAAGNVPLADKIVPAPTKDDVKFNVTGATYAEVTFSEDIEVVNNVAAFTVRVNGNAVDVKSVNAVNNVLRVGFEAPTGFVSSDVVEVIYNGTSKEIKDLKGNAAGTFSKASR